MAEHAEPQKQEEPQAVAKLTTEIVVAYVTRNTITPADLGDLIGSVARALGAVGREEPEPAKPKPAVAVRSSVHDDHLVCLLCGKQQKILRRHLDVAHQLSPEAYRELFGLRSDYPMAAPGYTRQRSEMGQACGSGTAGSGAITTPEAEGPHVAAYESRRVGAGHAVRVTPRGTCRLTAGN